MNASDLFVQHLYRTEGWAAGANSWGKTNPAFSHFDTMPVRVTFVETLRPLSELLDAKAKIRALFPALGKHSVHMSDTSKQTVEIGEVVLNANSVRHMHERGWSTLEERSKQQPCAPPADGDDDLTYQKLQARHTPP